MNASQSHVSTMVHVSTGSTVTTVSALLASQALTVKPTLMNANPSHVIMEAVATI